MAQDTAGCGCEPQNPHRLSMMRTEPVWESCYIVWIEALGQFWAV